MRGYLARRPRGRRSDVAPGRRRSGHRAGLRELRGLGERRRRAGRPGRARRLDRGRQGRVRDGRRHRQQGLVHARRGHAHRGLLPATSTRRACATASSSSPTARPSPTASDRDTTPRGAARRRRAASTYRQVEHREVRRLPDHQDLRHRPGARGGARWTCSSSRSTARRTSVYVLHDPALATTATTTRGRDRTAARCSPSDGTKAGSALRAAPGVHARPPAATSARSDGWTRPDAPTTASTGRYDRDRDRATSSRSAGRRLTGLAGPPGLHAGARLRRHRPARRPVDRAGVAGAAASRPRRRLRRAAGTPTSARCSRCPRARRRGGDAVQRLAMVLAASEDKTLPRRVRRRARRSRGPGVELTLAEPSRRLPRGVVARPLPDRHRAARGRATARPPSARWTSC